VLEEIYYSGGIIAAFNGEQSSGRIGHTNRPSQQVTYHSFCEVPPLTGPRGLDRLSVGLHLFFSMMRSNAQHCERNHRGNAVACPCMRASFGTAKPAEAPG
jgi:hypothetical protein